MEMGVSHTKLPCGSKDRDREREKERAKDGRDEIGEIWDWLPLL